MFSTVQIDQTATSPDLATVAEANAFLGLTSSTANDAIVAGDITIASEIIAAFCNRVFALHDVVETFSTGWADTGYQSSVTLKRVPIVTLTSVEENAITIDATDYMVDTEAGILWRHNCAWRPAWRPRTLVVTYTAGYDLPTDAPAALKRACLELIKEQRFAVKRSDPTVRSVQHDNLSIFYQQGTAAVSAGQGAFPPSVEQLIAPYRLPSAA